MIILIAAVAENNALGKNNDLLWHLPLDFKRFKEITLVIILLWEEKLLRASRNLYQTELTL